MADPYAVLGLHPGASMADIKAAFRKKAMAHHPDMHNTASEHVRAANDAAFKALNEAYQALMDGTYRPGQRGRTGAGRGAAAGAYGWGARGATWDPNYNPFASSYRGPGSGGTHWGYRQYARRGGFDWAGAFRPFAGLGRTQAAFAGAVGLLLAGGMLLLDPLAGSLWAASNEGKLFSAIEAEAAARKQKRAEEAAATVAARASQTAAAAAQQQQQQQQQRLAVHAVAETSAAAQQQQRAELPAGAASQPDQAAFAAASEVPVA